METKTSLDNPICRGDISTTKGLTDTRHPVFRGGLSSRSLSDFVSTIIEPKTYESFDNILKQTEFIRILKLANIFVFGKVGFFEIIQEGLKSTFLKEYPDTKFKVIRTLSDLKNKDRRPSSKVIEKKAGEVNDSPLILMPTVKSRADFNEIVSAAFETKKLIWLIALPSQLEKHLLVSFDCFFLPIAPKEEIGLLSDITPLDQIDIDEVSKADGVIAILSTAYNIPNLNVIEKKFGTVIYINQLTKSRIL